MAQGEGGEVKALRLFIKFGWIPFLVFGLYEQWHIYDRTSEPLPKSEIVKTTDNISYGFDCYRDENGDCHYLPSKPPGYWDKFTKEGK